MTEPMSSDGLSSDGLSSGGLSSDERPTAIVPVVDLAAPPPLAAVDAAPDAMPVPVAASPETDHARELIVCPECGTTAMIVLNRRDASDFCRSCDFPLFWTPAAVLREDSMRSVEDSLRRLPGTVGRATVASVACPHCAEPNQLSAQTCVRCGRPMHLEPEAPPPAPVYVPPPPAPVVVEPDRGVPWWAWLLVALGVVAIVALLLLAHYGYLG